MQPLPLRLLKKLKAAAQNDIGNVGVITNQSITFFPQDGFFADNGAFGNHTYEQQMHALTQVGATKPRPVLVNGGTADEWALQHGMSVSSEFTEVCHKLPKDLGKAHGWGDMDEDTCLGTRGGGHGIVTSVGGRTAGPVWEGAQWLLSVGECWEERTP